MKKTAQTLLTAAMFAAALGSAAGAQNTGAASAAEPADPENFYAAVEDPVDIYGPPSAFTRTTEPGTQPGTTAFEGGKTTFTLTTRNDPVGIYGPPSMMYPRGDITRDKTVDARDLSRMKQMILNMQDAPYSYIESEISDLNRDGKTDKEDLEIMLHEVLGVPKKEEPAVTTATALAVTTTAMTATTQPVVLLYGPPQMMTTVHVPVDINPVFTEPVVRPLYGPPDVMQTFPDAFRLQPEDTETSKTTATQTKDTGAAGKTSE
ncbi:MAG: hypothetical protein IJL32_15870 [Oscillospiraceae bacterium]|nr:hypothetical protein [Oscillospiraceae bacterium]